MHTGSSARCGKFQPHCISSVLLRGSPDTQVYVPSRQPKVPETDRYPLQRLKRLMSEIESPELADGYLSEW